MIKFHKNEHPLRKNARKILINHRGQCYISKSLWQHSGAATHVVVVREQGDLYFAFSETEGYPMQNNGGFFSKKLYESFCRIYNVKDNQSIYFIPDDEPSTLSDGKQYFKLNKFN